MKTIIHVNRAHIAANAKDGGNRPVYTLKMGGRTRYAREVEILGPSKLVYNGNQLSCGARAWIETDAEVFLTDEMSFAEARADALSLDAFWERNQHLNFGEVRIAYNAQLALERLAEFELMKGETA